MSAVLHALLTVPVPVAYAVIAALVFAEAALFVGFFFPGETSVFLGGVLAANGRMSVGVLIGLVVVAAVVGDTVGYEVGRHLGPRLLTARPLRRHRDRLGRAQEFVRHRGGWAVFLARYLTFVRAVTPALAGASRMPYRRFLAFNATGGLTWGVSIALLGYLAGNSYAAAQRALGTVSTGVAAAVLLAGGGYLLVRRHRRSSGRSFRSTGTSASPANEGAAQDEASGPRPLVSRG